MTNNNITLTIEESQKILQLAQEMRNFPPEHLQPENLLAWSRFFGIAPKKLGSHTSELSKTLERTYNILHHEGAIE